MNRKFLLTLLIAVFVMGSVLPILAQDDALVIWADDKRAPILEDVGAAFEEEFGIAVEVQQLEFGDVRSQVLTAAPAGEGPDIFIGAHDWLGEMVSNSIVASIDLGDVAEDFAQPSIDAWTFGGTLFGVPYASENVALIYNTDLVSEAPATWEDVFSISQELRESGDAEYGFVMQEGNGFFFFPIQTAFGGYIFGENEDGWDPSDIGVGNEGSQAAGTWLQELYDADLQPEAADYDTVMTLMKEGDAAMMINGPWAIPDLQDAEVPFAVASLPAGPAGDARPFLGVQAFMVSAFSENLELATAFLLDYVATPDIMQQIFDADPRVPNYLPVVDSTTDEITLGFVAAGENGWAMPNIPEMGSVWQAWGDNLTLITQGQLSGAEAFAQAGEQVAAAIEGSAEEMEEDMEEGDEEEMEEDMEEGEEGEDSEESDG